METLSPTPAGNVPLSCPICTRPMERSEFDSGPQLCPCPRSRRFEAVLFRPPGPAAPVVRQIGFEGGQPCARHEGNAASANCERCGVFMCSLCEVEVDGQKLCPDCFDRRTAGGEQGAAHGRRRDWTAVAYLSAFCGLFFSCFGAGLLLGPLAIYFALRSLREKRARGEQGGTSSDYLAVAFGVLVTLGSLGGIAVIVIGVLSDG